MMGKPFPEVGILQRGRTHIRDGNLSRFEKTSVFLLQFHLVGRWSTKHLKKMFTMLLNASYSNCLIYAKPSN